MVRWGEGLRIGALKRVELQQLREKRSIRNDYRSSRREAVLQIFRE